MAQNQPIELNLQIKPDGTISLDLTVAHIDELRQATQIISEALDKAAWVRKMGDGKG